MEYCIGLNSVLDPFKYCAGVHLMLWVVMGGSRVGIGGMRERVRQFRGNIKTASNSSGTTILVNIPV